MRIGTILNYVRNSQNTKQTSNSAKPPDGKIPATASTLLDKAIENAYLIEEKYYNTKYRNMINCHRFSNSIL